MSDIALTEPQAQAASFVANKSDNSSLSGESIFKYLDCERIFNAEQALSHHINIDHEGVKYACNQCDKKFTQQITLTRHILSIHEGFKYPCCDQCGKQWKAISGGERSAAQELS